MSPANRSTSAYHGTAAHDRAGIETLAARFDVAHASILEVNPRGATDAHLSAALLDESARRLRVELIERPRRQRERRVLGSAAEHLREHGRERRRGRHAHRLIQRRERERLPQHLSDSRASARC